jgi:hypothetical protein
VTPPRSDLSVRSSREPRRLAELRAEWSALFDAAADPSPFLSPEWIESGACGAGGRPCAPGSANVNTEDPCAFPST